MYSNGMKKPGVRGFFECETDDSGGEIVAETEPCEDQSHSAEALLVPE